MNYLNRSNFISTKGIVSTLASIILSLWSINIAASTEIITTQKENILGVTNNDISKRENFKHKITDDEFSLISQKQFTLCGLGLFSGNDITSAAIRELTKSKTSHCSLILKDHVGEWYCLESTGSYDEIMHQGMLPQVQIHLWQNVVNNYGGKVKYRTFTFTSLEQNTPETINSILIDELGKPYETNLLSLIEALLGKNKSEDLSSLFCSEFNAAALMRMGYLGKEKLAANYLPRDFTEEPGIILNLINATLSDTFKAIPKTVNDNTGDLDDGSNDTFNGGPCRRCVIL